MTDRSPIPSAMPASVIDLAAARTRRDRLRLAAFEGELRRRLCAFLDAPANAPASNARGRDEAAP